MHHGMISVLAKTFSSTKKYILILPAVQPQQWTDIYRTCVWKWYLLHYSMTLFWSFELQYLADRLLAMQLPDDVTIQVVVAPDLVSPTFSGKSRTQQDLLISSVLILGSFLNYLIQILSFCMKTSTAGLVALILVIKSKDSWQLLWMLSMILQSM